MCVLEERFLSLVDKWQGATGVRFDKQYPGASRNFYTFLRYGDESSAGEMCDELQYIVSWFYESE